MYTFSSLLICPEYLDSLPAGVHRPVQTSGMVIQATRELSVKSRPYKVEGKFDVEINSQLQADSAATSCWCYLSFGCCAHMVDFAKSSHILPVKSRWYACARHLFVSAYMCSS